MTGSTAYAELPVRRAELDDATSARGRGSTIEPAEHFTPYYKRTIPAAVAGARDRLRAALTDG